MPILEKSDIASTNNLKKSYILRSIENSFYTSEEVDCADLWESSKKNNNILKQKRHSLKLQGVILNTSISDYDSNPTVPPVIFFLKYIKRFTV